MADLEAARLHRALIELCYEQDYEQLDAAQLARRAELPLAALQERYQTLDLCFAAALSECADQFLAKMQKAYAGGGPRWQDRLRAAAYTALYHLQEDPVRAHFTLIEAINGGERARLVRERVYATVAGFLDEGRRLPSADPDLSEATAAALNGGFARQMRLRMERIETDRAAEFLPQIMYAAVLPYVGSDAAAEELEYQPPVPLFLRPGAQRIPPLPPRKVRLSNAAERRGADLS